MREKGKTKEKKERSKRVTPQVWLSVDVFCQSELCCHGRKKKCGKCVCVCGKGGVRQVEMRSRGGDPEAVQRVHAVRGDRDDEHHRALLLRHKMPRLVEMVSRTSAVHAASCVAWPKPAASAAPTAEMSAPVSASLLPCACTRVRRLGLWCGWHKRLRAHLLAQKKV